MTYAQYTSLIRPTRSDAENNGQKFSGEWKIVGGEQFSWTDCVWFVNGGQFESHPGMGGSVTSDNMTLTATDWHPYKPGRKVTEVRYETRGTMTSGYWGPFSKSPALAVRPPLKPTVTVAKGSGTSVQEVNRLMNQFNQSRQLMKQMTNKKFMKRASRGGFPFGF